MTAEYMTEAESEMLLELARAIMPAGAILDEPGIPVVKGLEHQLRSLGYASVIGVRALLRGLDAAARLRYGRPFSRLQKPEQLNLVDKIRRVPWPFRVGTRALLTALKLARYDDEETFHALGLRYRADSAVVSKQRWMGKIVDGSDLVEDTTIEADVVVVGTGAGGGVVGRELARRGLAVVFVEEGRLFTRADFTGRPLEMQTLMYRLGGLQMALGNCNLFCPAGRTVGGSTTINAGTCLRAEADVFLRWQRELGLTEYSPELMEAFYERVEQVLGVSVDGELWGALLGANAGVMARGADALGYRHGPLPRNAPDCDGQGVCGLGCPTDAKRSTNISCIPPALDGTAFLYTGIEVDQVKTQGDRAVGVSGRAIDSQDHRLTVQARATVLACGTYLTPLLLLRSRVANRSGQVGRNLSVQPSGYVGALFDEVIDGWRSVPQSYSVDHFRREGLNFETAFVPLDLAATLFDLIGRDLTEFVEAIRNLALGGFIIADRSRGRVLPLRGNVPLIRYSINARDWFLMRQGFERLAELYFAAGARKVFLPIAGHTVLEDEAALGRFRRARLAPSSGDFSAFHPTGTCRMGATSSRSVVSPGFETWDVRDLFIADGSVIPTPLGANSQLTIMALAAKAADHIAERLGEL